GQDLVPDNHTYFYDPVLRLWNYVQGPPDPFRRFAAPGTWLSANQCPGLFLIGGSSSLPSPPADQWFLDPNPDTEVGCNTWGNDRVGGNNGSNNGGNGTGLPPGCVADANLSVLELSSTTGAPIANGTVLLSGYCGPYSHRTNSHGYANFTKVPAWLTDVRATALGYRSNGTYLNFTPNATTYHEFNLTPLPVLRLHARGIEVGGASIDLANVSIWVNGAPTPNVTDPTGWWNVTGLNIPLGATTFTGLLANYSSPTATAVWPYTGDVWVNLTLFAFGPMEIHVLVAGAKTPIPGAVGVITPLDAAPQGGVVPFRADVNGSAELLIPGGNYSVEAAAPGFLAATTTSAVVHPWATVTLVTILLTFESSFSLDVRLLNGRTHAPIEGGTVIVGASRTLNSSTSGWANFTGISPAGEYAVYGIASGYRGNETVARLSYFLPTLVHAELNLTPLLPCPPTCGGPNGTTPVLFTLLPPGGWGVTWLTAAPLIFVVGALAYWAGSRRRLGAEVPGST
ncbi:MAG: carboxypeptidase-like regulatory domain-containing protein, partial [Thermoplasmata archaeon]|nr:carboxypeptidase-like regulatory domain-containing protein [Thermoplasmata archaeon]